MTEVAVALDNLAVGPGSTAAVLVAAVAAAVAEVQLVVDTAVLVPVPALAHAAAAVAAVVGTADIAAVAVAAVAAGSFAVRRWRKQLDCKQGDYQEELVGHIQTDRSQTRTECDRTEAETCQASLVCRTTQRQRQQQHDHFLGDQAGGLEMAVRSDTKSLLRPKTFATAVRIALVSAGSLLGRMNFWGPVEKGGIHQEVQEQASAPLTAVYWAVVDLV